MGIMVQLEAKKRRCTIVDLLALFCCISMGIPSFESKFVQAFAPNYYNIQQKTHEQPYCETLDLAFKTSITQRKTKYQINPIFILRDDFNNEANIKESLFWEALENGDATIHEFELMEHKPLGCTVEESAVVEDDGSRSVFISKVTEGGNAEKGGLAVGDVIIGISGIFDEVEDVAGAGIERIRTLVGGRYPDQSLHIKVIRGTDVMSRHESYLVTLCTLPGGTDDNLDECLNSIMGEVNNEIEDNNSIGMDCDEEGECMLDTMFEAWGGELLEDVGSDPSKTPETEMEIEAQKKKNNARPWASRSSPSGTYVRDVATGKMRNVG